MALSWLATAAIIGLVLGFMPNTVKASDNEALTVSGEHVANQETSQVTGQVYSQVSGKTKQCNRVSEYDIYLSGIHTGTMKRTESWQGQSAVVTSTSKASILGIGTQYDQRAELSWSNTRDEWITDNFHQLVTGFRARDMKVSFSQNGLESEVDIDGEKDRYTSTEIPLRDVDTLAIQMRQLLLQGRTQFALIRQASDAIEPYQLYVKEAVKSEVAPWGEITLIPVEQSGAEEVTYYFAPEMDFQLVKARYHGIILKGLIELNDYSSTCE